MDYERLKPLLFRLDPETAHHMVAGLLGCAQRFTPLFSLIPGLEEPVRDERLSQELMGLRFDNPVGLAAGFDKNGELIGAMARLGFGFTEVGTVTPRPQPGNPRPRIWRHVKEEALQNAMGFNNDGAEALGKRLKKARPYPIPVGVNIGKNKITPEEKALEDYAACIDTLADLADYLVVNISSPNTPGLRDLQNEAFIAELFAMIKEKTDKPVLLKIAPDMSEASAVTLCVKAVEVGAAGIIATNTSIDYSLVAHPVDRGGISGRPIREKSFAIFEAIAKELFGRALLVSVGGIDSGYEAYRRIKAGASLVQVYTGLIYRGPGLPTLIDRTLLHLLEKDGFSHISEAVGVDRR
ncbi:quinone-dependent dihydroorotate dehydrogenase [Hydrogenimonas sp.]